VDDRRELVTRLRDAGFDPEARSCGASWSLPPPCSVFRAICHSMSAVSSYREGPSARLVPIENAAMPERSVIQWDKDDLENLGLLKVDVLALGMLSAIRRALDFVNELRSSAITMDGLLREEDPAVYEMMRHADTIGVFQIESRAQMSMLPRLKPEHFYDLVIEIAIVRPGPIQGDMVHPYLRRRARHGTDRLSERSGEKSSRAHLRGADFPGAGDAARGSGGRLHPGRSGSIAPRDGRLAPQGRAGAFPQSSWMA